MQYIIWNKQTVSIIQDTAYVEKENAKVKLKEISVHFTNKQHYIMQQAEFLMQALLTALRTRTLRYADNHDVINIKH